MTYTAHGITESVVICVPFSHPSFPHWESWGKETGFKIAPSIESLLDLSADYLFLISCTEIIGQEIRGRFKHCIVIHESYLPKGRGWSPLAWQILEGKNDIPVSAIKCADKVDSGDIIKRSVIYLDGSELYDEIHTKSFEVKSGLVLSIVVDQTMSRADADIAPQLGQATYYKRRTPEDSRLDTAKSIDEQFNLLRICEPRFPAFFEKNGFRYEITLRKAR